MRTVLCLVAAALLVALPGGRSGQAALDLAPARGTTLELLVYEHPDCIYCQLFRRDVLPRYQQGIASELPIHFVDIATSGNERPGLHGKVDTLPTAILMREGHEVDRIVGYWGPDNFFKLLAYLRAKAE
jgi:thioredoxin-related protein